MCLVCPKVNAFFFGGGGVGWSAEAGLEALGCSMLGSNLSGLFMKLPSKFAGLEVQGLP